MENIDDKFVEEPLKTEEMIDEEVNRIMAEEYTPKQKDKYWELNIEPEDIELLEQCSQDDLPEVKTKDKDLLEQLEEYQRQLDQEISEELQKTYKPSLDEEDVKRANALLERDALIKKAVDENIISKEEVIIFIDYYEIFSKMNQCKRFTLEELKKMDQYLIEKYKANNEEEGEEEYEEEEEEEENNENTEDAIKRLTNDIEKEFTVDNCILNNRLNADLLTFNKADF